MSTDASFGIDPRNRPPRRPPLIRSQSDSNPSLTFPASLQKNPVPSPSSLLENYHPTGAHGLGASSNSPSRPPRNPARMVQERLITIQSPIPLLPTARLTMKSKRPRTATGTREEVTPWELHPPPDSYGDNMPKSPVVVGSAVEPISKRILRSPNIAHPGSSPGINTGISFPDISLLRRKSTGSKLHKNKPSGNYAPHTTRPLPTNTASPPTRQQSVGQLTRHSPKSPQATPRAVQKLPSRDALPDAPTLLENQSITEGPSLSHSSSSTTTSSSFGPHKSTSMTSSEIHRKNLKFSTADRTILDELKKNIQARASQFVTKGGGPAGLNMAELGVASTFSAGRVGGIGGGKKHHAYSKEEVPYPRSYERDVLDLDVWETLFCKQICGSLTWHEFEQPPTKVLDIGCGTGSWILDCARIWRQCHFVGLDIVPLHPDLKQVGSNELAQRITWIQENFLDGLPFPNEEFDFVHIKRIARGVPEDKWDFLFEEITRVMKPGGAFEMIEEDLFFPGRRDDENGDGEDEDDANYWSQGSRFPILRIPPVGPSRNPVSSSVHRYSGVTVPLGPDISDIEHDLDSESLFTISPSNASTSPDRVSPPSPGATTVTLASAHNKSVGTSGREVGAIVEDEEGELCAGNGLGTPLEDTHRHDRFGTDSTIRPRSATVPSSHPSERNQLPPLHIASTNNGSSGPNPTKNKPPISLLLRSPVSSSNTSHDFQPNLASLQHRKVTSNLHPPSASSSGVPSPERPLQSGSVASVSPFVLRQLPKPPVDPRDHSLLEMIYNEMHSSRFINLSPLSILPNTLSLHFKDVRTHAPLQFRFPPRVIRSGTGLRTDDQAHDPRYHPDSIDDEIEVQGTTPVFSTVTAIPWVRMHSTVSSEKQFFLSKAPLENLDAKYPKEDEYDGDNFLTMRSLVKGTSPYVSLDDSRPTAFSPSARASFLKSPSKQRIEIPLSDTERARLISPDSPGSPKTTPFAIAASISMLRNSLPNQKLHVDLRSLNLHLWARVAEILACTETMWEWVLDYQRKIRAEKATRTQRARSKSVDVHPRFIAPAPEATSDRLKAAISLLTRQEYEDLLLRFYMDMQDHIGIEHAIQQRFGWKTFRTSPTMERKSFDDACKQYVLWKQDQRARRGDRPSTATPRTRSRPLSASYTPNFSPLDSFSSTSQEALQLEGLPATSDGAIPSISSHSFTGITKERARRERSSSYTVPKSQTSRASSESQRLSRAMRVFVAWKAD